jgi:integrase
LAVAATAEEVDRLIEAARKCRPQDYPAWQFYIRGLFYSGLRLDESLRLSWDEFAPFAVDLTGGRRPAFRIAAAAQKSRRPERLLMTEEFYNLLMEVLEAERIGPVFKLNGLKTNVPMTVKRVCRVVAAIGRKAGVVVAVTKKRKRDKNGKEITVTVKKFCSAHDIRRGFCFFGSRRVGQAVLM